ncbi:MAG TPA: YciI family protein [Thermoanaerobaculia bacterium]
MPRIPLSLRLATLMISSLILAIAPTPAAAAELTPIGPDDGTVTALVATGASTVYAANADASAFRSCAARREPRLCRSRRRSFVVRLGAGTRGLPPADPRPHNRRGETTMRFMSIIRIDETTGQKPSEQLMSDMGKLIEEMTKQGVLLDTAGLRPTAEGTRVRLRKGGKLTVVDGPFTEAKEVLGGYAIFNVGSKDEAIDLTRRFLTIHGEEWNIECEVRQLEEPDLNHPQ